MASLQLPMATYLALKKQFGLSGFECKNCDSKRFTLAEEIVQGKNEEEISEVHFTCTKCFVTVQCELC
jgi:hypothetical protein